MITYRCTARPAESGETLPGQRSGQLYAKVCVGTHVSTTQRLVTYRGVGGPDDGKHWHCTLSHWRSTFEVFDDRDAEEK